MSSTPVRRIHVITHFVSPYQVELFNAVAARPAIEVFVTYLYDSWKGRYWKDISIQHPHCVVHSAIKRASVDEQVRCQTDESDVVVFNTYRDRLVWRMMRRRARGGAPWAFWGERPAFRYKGRLGTIYRRWRLAPLHRCNAPIWGIGSWATRRYRDEFGSNRCYADLPYFSDLVRFRRGTDATAAQDNGGSGVRRFLYSGALIPRKGPDLLSRAFRNLLNEGHHAHLTIMGTGELESSLRKTLDGLEQHVAFVGFQDWQQLPPWYHRAEILVAPSLYDGWGLIVPEGLAAGLPVVATNMMGAAIDLIEPDRNGWICQAGNEESLTQRLRSLSTMDDAQLQQHRRWAEDSVSSHQLSDGARTFVQRCEDLIDSWGEIEGLGV